MRYYLVAFLSLISIGCGEVQPEKPEACPEYVYSRQKYNDLTCLHDQHKLIVTKDLFICVCPGSLITKYEKIEVNPPETLKIGE